MLELQGVNSHKTPNPGVSSAPEAPGPRRLAPFAVKPMKGVKNLPGSPTLPDFLLGKAVIKVNERKIKAF